MADAVDRATELNEERLQAALENRPNMARPSAQFCVDCDELIPPERQAVGGVRRCVPCQEQHEKRRA